MLKTRASSSWYTLSCTNAVVTLNIFMEHFSKRNENNEKNHRSTKKINSKKKVEALSFTIISKRLLFNFFHEVITVQKTTTFQ